MKKACIILVYYFSCVGALMAQVRDIDLELEQLIEEVLPFMDEEADYETLYENFLLFYSSPVDLNKGDANLLYNLYILSEEQIQNLMLHLQKYGPMASIYELQAVKGFDSETIRKVLPFVKVGTAEKFKLSDIIHNDNQYLITRYERTLESRRGFLNIDGQDPAFAGSRDKVYLRYRNNISGKFSLGFTLEKDAGEQFIWEPGTRRYGFDFHSFHFQYFPGGRVKRITIGDFQVQSGQGLVFGGGFFLGKSAETINTVRRAQVGVLPYTSVLESGFFRGGAVTVGINKNLDLTTFYSNNRISASIQQDAGSDTDFFSSIRLTGLHRTNNELSGRRAVEEMASGANLHYQNQKTTFQAGLNYLYNSFEMPFVRTPNRINQFEFSGTTNQNFSAYYRYLIKNINLFGESAVSASGGLAHTHGMTASLTEGLDWAMLYRSYSRNYHSFYGNAFGESSRNINETGLYWALRYRWDKKWSAQAYYDYFSFPWSRFRAERPGHGHEYLVRINYRHDRNTWIFLQIRSKTRPRNELMPGEHLFRLTPGERQVMTLNMDYPVKEGLLLKTRIQASRFIHGANTTKGFALIQDANWRFRNFRISGRTALFNTDDFDNAIYVFERNALYAFALPPYSGVGIRQYILIQYRPVSKVTIWARWARTRFLDREVIGSGQDMIDGPTRTDITLQTMIRF